MFIIHENLTENAFIFFRDKFMHFLNEKLKSDAFISFLR